MEVLWGVLVDVLVLWGRGEVRLKREGVVRGEGVLDVGYDYWKFSTEDVETRLLVFGGSDRYSIVYADGRIVESNTALIITFEMLSRFSIS